MTTVDNRFVREGRSLPEWMLQLVSSDRAERRAAQNAISAMLYGLPTADSPSDESIVKDAFEHRAAFYGAIEAVGGDESFPAGTFVPAAVDRMLAAHREYMESVEAEDALMDEWMEMPGDPMEDPAIAARMERLKRRKAEEYAGRGRMSFGDQMLNVVFKHLGKALLLAPDAVRRALADPVVASAAKEGLTRMGPAAIRYAPMFIEELDGSTEWFRSADVLGAIGRGSSHVVDALITRVRQGWGVVRMGAVATLSMMGTEVAGREEEIVSMLIELVRAPEDEARPVALGALGSVGRDGEDALAVVMEFAGPRPPRMRKVPRTEYEYDEVLCERGVAISALGNFVRFADRVTPVLVDALDSFVEFDPDEMRDDDGGYGRVMDAVRKLGTGAAGATAALAGRLRAEDGEIRWGIVRALGEMGPAASAALPALEQLRGEVDGGSDDGPVSKAIRQIRG
jgi:hypothetical protein